MRLYGIPSVKAPDIAFAASLTYWVFRCRDRAKTPANGTKTWEYLQSSIKNAATPARSIDDYLENLCNRLIVPSLRPGELTKILDPQQVVLRAKKNPDGTLGDISEMNIDQVGLRWLGWQDILAQDLNPAGITDRHILTLCRQKPHVIGTYARLRFEEDRAIGVKDEEEAIDV